MGKFASVTVSASERDLGFCLSQRETQGTRINIENVSYFEENGWMLRSDVQIHMTCEARRTERGVRGERMKSRDRGLKRMGVGGRLPGWLGLEAPGGRLCGWASSICRARDQVHVQSLAKKIYCPWLLFS